MLSFNCVGVGVRGPEWVTGLACSSFGQGESSLGSPSSPWQVQVHTTAYKPGKEGRGGYEHSRSYGMGTMCVHACCVREPCA